MVDSPANELEFNVIKRLNQEDGDMSVENTEVNKAGDDPNAIQTVPVEITKAAGEAVEKAMAQVTTLVEEIAKAASAAAPAAATDTAADADGGTETDVEKADELSKLRKLFERNGVKKGPDLEKAMADAVKQFPGQFKPGAATKPPLKKKGEASTQKNVEGGEGGEGGEGTETATQKNTEAAPEDDVQVMKALEALGTAVEKAKAFTPKRQADLQKAIDVLNDLMKQLTMQQIPTGASPPTTTPSGASFGASGTIALTKKLGELGEVLGQFADVQKSINERVDTIEKTRQPSTSVEVDGGTETKTEKSLWSGVL